MSDATPLVSSSSNGWGDFPSCKSISYITLIALGAIALVTGVLTFLHLQFGISLGGMGALANLGMPGSLGLAGSGFVLLLGCVIYSICQHDQKPPASTQGTESKPVPTATVMVPVPGLIPVTERSPSPPPVVETVASQTSAPVNVVPPPTAKPKPNKLAEALGARGIFSSTKTRPSSIVRESDLRSELVDEFKRLIEACQDLWNVRRCRLARLPETKKFNRYNNIFSADEWLYPLHDPNLSTKSVIENWDGIGEPPYINASRMCDSGDILTQGPLDHTFNSFWKMVWMSRAAVVVMLTNFEEGDKVKCAHYYPETIKENKLYWPFRVTLQSEHPKVGFTTRAFTLSLIAGDEEESRTLSHVQCSTWNDQEAFSIDDLFKIISHVYEIAKGEPIITHCSAGVGRSGVFYACYLIYSYWKQHPGKLQVDAFTLVQELRIFRPLIVQSDKQYDMIYAFAELLNSMNA